MKRIHIVGRRNHGKTTLIVELVGQLTGRGYRVGTIKHSSHRHELDTPGKDSHRHRQAGAAPVAVVARDLVGIYVPRAPDAAFYHTLQPMYRDCDLVLVEGHIDCDDPKIEVWRGALGGQCLATQRDDISAVVSDDEPAVNVPVWPRRDVPALAESICRLAGVARRHS